LNGVLYRGRITDDLKELRKVSDLFGGDSVKLLDALAKPGNDGEFSGMQVDKPEQVKIKTADGVELNGWYFKGSGSDTVLMCYDGFGKRLALLAGYPKMFKDLGLSALLFDYRGYRDENVNVTPDTGVIDGQAAYDFLTKEKKVDPAHLILLGRNLGTYVCLQIAQKNPCKAFVLENPWSKVKEAMEGVPGAIAMKLVPESLYTEDCLNEIHLVKPQHQPILVLSSDPQEYSSDKFMAAVPQPIGYLWVSEYFPTDLCVNMEKSGGRYREAVKDLLAGKLASTDTRPKVNWMTSYDKAFAKAKEQNKPVMIDLRADWCGPCRMMDRATFADPKVVEAVEENFVPLRLDDADAAAGALCNKYSITGIPTVLIMQPDEALVKKHSGFQDPDRFLKFLTPDGKS
jgi:thiol-disulfide isomerase/thioredoxin